MSAMGLPLRLPGDAHHTLYVEGIPGDASERELAHIFRPFPGYISLRLRAKGGRNLGQASSANSDAICFVEFESAYHVRVHGGGEGGGGGGDFFGGVFLFCFSVVVLLYRGFTGAWKGCAGGGGEGGGLYFSRYRLSCVAALLLVLFFVSSCFPAVCSCRGDNILAPAVRNPALYCGDGF